LVKVFLPKHTNQVRFESELLCEVNSFR
jgi:hypothetical protein